VTLHEVVFGDAGEGVINMMAWFAVADFSKKAFSMRPISICARSAQHAKNNDHVMRNENSCCQLSTIFLL